MRRLLLAISILFTFASALMAADGPRRDHTVILVSIDGLANFYLDDPAAKMPTLRRLIGEGVRAEGMVCVFPTVTWPNHTTLVTGVPPSKHGVLGNYIFDRERGEKLQLVIDPHFDKDEIVKSPTIYDAAAQVGLKTAAVVWPCTRNARTLDFTVPDADGDIYMKYGTPAWLAELRAAGFPVDKYGAWFKDMEGGAPHRDRLTSQLACQLIEKHQPNLLLVHFIAIDNAEHRWGPQTPQAYAAVEEADQRLREVVDAVAASPRKDKTTILVCSDHGFFPIDREIRPNVLFRKLGLIETEGDKITKKLAWAVHEGGACAIHVFGDHDRAAAIEKLKAELAKIEGVDRVIASSEFADLGQPTSIESRHGADLWLSGKKGYYFNDSIVGDDIVVPGKPTYLGTHGYQPRQPELYATFVAWGANVPKAQRIPRINNTDVAPTIARLLNFPFPSADGKPVDSIGNQ